MAYDADHVWYFDAIESDGVKALAGLIVRPEQGILDLVFQTDRDETVTIPYLPGSRVPLDSPASREIQHTVIHLATKDHLNGNLWLVLEKEMQLRREWIQSHNLDQEAFRRFNKAMSRYCR